METKHYSGLNDSEVQQSRKQFGENIITPPPHTPLWKLFLEKFKDYPYIVGSSRLVADYFYHAQ